MRPAMPSLLSWDPKRPGPAIPRQRVDGRKKAFDDARRDLDAANDVKRKEAKAKEKGTAGPKWAISISPTRPPAR